MSRTLDALVAEKVMAWPIITEHTPYRCHRDTAGGVVVRRDDGSLMAHIFQVGRGTPVYWFPTSNASDDYEVLKHVRENWDRGNQLEFARALFSIQRQRGVFSFHPGYHYEPGDFSRAALKAIGEEV